MGSEEKTTVNRL